MSSEKLRKPIHLEHSSLKFPLPELFLQELQESLFLVNDYPSGGYYKTLSNRLAEYIGINPDYILPTNGSDEVIESVTRAFGRKTILIPVPTFSQYEVSADRNGFPKKLVFCLQNNQYRLNYSLEDLKNASLIWICNPNNPTGTPIPREEIISILCTTRGIVAVDECNYEYLGESVVDLINQYPNLVVSRSFSKNFGLAGLRLGFAISLPQNISKIAHYCQHFRVNSMAEVAGIKVLKYLDYFQKIWQEIARIRDFFIAGLEELGIVVFPSQANFVLADFITEEKTRRVWQYLKGEKVYTFAAWGNEFSGLDRHYLRFTISNQKEMSYVLELLKKFPGNFF